MQVVKTRAPIFFYKLRSVLKACGLMLAIPYSGKFSREKTFMNFAIFQPSAKVFSTKF